MTTAALPRRRPPATTDPATAYARAVVAGEIVAGNLVRLACERHLRDLKHGHERGLVWRADKAKKAIDFFGILKLPDGPGAGGPFVLLPWQEFVVGSLFGWYGADGRRRFHYALVEVARANGKALALDTPIPTPDGWTTMGDLKAGDRVIDETGQPCNVIGATQVMFDRPCYEVTFNDGSKIVADAEHEWFTFARRRGGPRQSLKGRPRSEWLGKGRSFTDGAGIRTTRELADSVLVSDVRGFREHNYSIPNTKPLVLPLIDLPVPPYVLGAWLGDGNSSDARLTCSYEDGEILARIEADGVSVNERVSSNANTGRYILGGGTRTQPARNESVQAKLRGLGVLGDKHIPTAYLRSSIAQRMALLRGLMDTDGYVSKAGQCEFTSINRRLAEDVQELVVSLGFKPTIATGRATIYGRDCGPKYRVLFYADQPVFDLSRKRDRQKPLTVSMARKLSHRYIISVEPVESVPVRCITVDSPSHLYLAGRSMIPTHNSPLAAGIGLYMLAMDGETGAQVYSAATTRDQAKIVFNDAVAMAEKSPSFWPLLTKTVNNLAFLQLRSYLRPLAAEASTMDGLRVHGAMVDELHEHPNGEVLAKLRTGMKSSQPLLFMITTAGYDRHSVCYDEHEQALKVLEGVIGNDTYFAFIATLDDGEDWTDESCWPKANPSLGTTVRIETLRDECELAKQIPGQQNSFKRLRLNVWTESSTRWLDLAVWDRNAGEVDADALKPRPCFAGADLSSTTDLTALELYFPDDDGGGDWLHFYFVPEENMRRRAERDRVPYDVWAKDGLLTATPGNVVDYDYIRAKLNELVDEGYTIQEIAYDPWNATQLVTDLMGDSFTCVPIRQGFASLTAPTKEFEKLLLAGQFRGLGHPVTRWAASNVTVEQDAAGNLKPSKAKSTERIDPVVAMIMALDRAIRQPEQQESEVWWT